METLAYNILRKAKKEHKCNWCSGTIPKGMMYETSTHKHEGDLYSWKSHFGCSKLVQKSAMVDYSGDGITADDFREYVCYEYQKLTNDDTGDATWQQRLEYVLKHYEIS